MFVSSRDRGAFHSSLPGMCLTPLPALTNCSYLIMEYVPGGELFDYLVRRGRLPPNEALHYFQQIIFAVDYCHRFNICHRDLKPENLLLDKDKNIKVADFGMAAWQADERMLETSCGSPHYASPEIVAGKAYNGSASDIWSCGIILFALLTGRLPFDDDNIRTLLQKVKIGHFEMPDDIDMSARDLLRKMLDKDPEERITMPEIMAHPFFIRSPPRLAGGRELPTPLALDTMARPVPVHDIDPDIMANLRTLWHGATQGEIYKALMSPEKTWEKAIYHLLVKYRNRHLENYNMDDDSDEEDTDEDRARPHARPVRAQNAAIPPGSPQKMRRIEEPSAGAQQAQRRAPPTPVAPLHIRRKPAPLRENGTIQHHNTPPPRPQAPTPKKAAQAAHAAFQTDSPVVRTPSKLGPRSPAPAGPRSPGGLRAPPAPAITLQEATPVKEPTVPQAKVSAGDGINAAHVAGTAAAMGLADAPQLPPLSPPHVENAQLQNFLCEIANQLNSMHIRSSTASSSSGNSALQGPEFAAYMQYMSTVSATPVTSPRPEQQNDMAHRLGESARIVEEEEEGSDDQFGDAPDDDTEAMSLNSISVDHHGSVPRYASSPVPASPMSPMVGLGLGAAPRAPSRNSQLPPPVSGRWSQASGSYRTRSMSSRCESPVLTTPAFHQTTFGHQSLPPPETQPRSVSAGHAHHSLPPAPVSHLHAERSAPPPPPPKMSTRSAPPAPRTVSNEHALPVRPRVESHLGRENSYVMIDDIADMPDDTKTSTWGSRRSNGPFHARSTDGFGMLKKRKKQSGPADPVASTLPNSHSSPKHSWFGNLFSFKPASYDIIVPCPTVSDGRDIVRRCLMVAGVQVKIVEYDGCRALKCKILDTRDIYGKVVKGVRFRIEFSRMVVPTSEAQDLRFGTNACLTLEKGAQSSFTTAYNALKKAVEAEASPLSPVAVPRTSFTLPRPSRPGARPSLFDAGLNVPAPVRSFGSAPNTPQFGPQFGTYAFTGVNHHHATHPRPNTIRF